MVQAISSSLHPDEGLSLIQRNLSAMSEEIEATPASAEAEPFPDIRTFIQHPGYCGDSGFWEKPMQELETICAPGCKGAVIEKGIRGSKSYSACYIPVYFTCAQLHQEFVVGEDPRELYGLAEDTIIYNAIFTVTGKLSRRLYSYIASFVDRCKWLKEPEVYDKIRRNPAITSEIQFCLVEDGKLQPDKVRYVIYPGTSKLTSAAGVALWCYILDECNLFTNAESSGLDYAEELDTELDKRVTSSFGKYGKRIYISRRDIENDFTQRKIAQWSKDPEAAYKFHMPPPKTSWADWPDSRNHAELWRLFEPDKFDWAKDEQGNNLPARTYDEIKDSDGWWVPERFWTDFTVDPEGSLRVLGSIPAGAKTPYFRRRDLVVPDFDLESPVKPHVKPHDWMRELPDNSEQTLWEYFDTLVEDWFVGERGEYYHFHADLALNKQKGAKQGDAAGFAVVRNAGVDEAAYIDSEGRPERCVLVDVELAIQIKAPPGGEVMFRRVREIIYWLSKHRGFRFLQSSYDGWQSVESIQTLTDEGYEVDTLSVDGAKSLLHYNTLKQGLYEKRFAFPPAHGQTPRTSYRELSLMADNGDSSAILQRELLQLELVRGAKVDHPAHGSKDVADAVCGACCHAASYLRPNAGVML